jgi:hypothetical protein
MVPRYAVKPAGEITGELDARIHMDDAARQLAADAEQTLRRCARKCRADLAPAASRPNKRDLPNLCISSTDAAFRTKLCCGTAQLCLCASFGNQ